MRYWRIISSIFYLWFLACHDVGFVLSVWGLLLSMFLKLQVQGQMRWQLNLRQIDWTNPHLMNILYLVYVFFKEHMAWYVVYRGKEPGVYAIWPTCHAQVSGFANCCYKCLWNLLAVLRATNQALKYLGYWLLLWFSRFFWWCLSFSLLSIVVGASNCFILPVMASKCHEHV